MRHMHPDDLLPIGEAARIWGVSVDTARRWADVKGVPHVRTPTGHRRFRRRDVEALLADDPKDRAS